MQCTTNFLAPSSLSSHIKHLILATSTSSSTSSQPGESGRKSSSVKGFPSSLSLPPSGGAAGAVQVPVLLITRHPGGKLLFILGKLEQTDVVPAKLEKAREILRLAEISFRHFR